MSKCIAVGLWTFWDDVTHVRVTFFFDNLAAHYEIVSEQYCITKISISISQSVSD